MTRLISLRVILVLLLHCNVLFAILNPGQFMELSSYWYFVLAICVGGIIYTRNNLMPKIQYEKYIFFCIIWQILVIPITFIVMGKVNMAYLLSFILFLSFFYVCLKLKLDDSEIRKILNSYIYSGVIVSILLFTQPIPYGSGDIRFTLRLHEDSLLDPNYLAALLVFPAILAFSKLLFNFSFKAIILWGTFFLIILIGLFLTGSRNAMISVAIGALFSFFQYIRKGLNLKKLIFSFIMLYIVVLVVLHFLPEGTYSRLFLESYHDDSNTKRILDWKAGLDAFFQHPIFGYGFTSEFDAIKISTRKELVAHNTFIGLLIQFGITGFLIYLVGLYHLIIDFSRNKELMLLGATLATLLLALIVSAQVSVFFWFPIIAIVCIYNNMRRNNKQIKEYF